jgi:hypothetical protein
MTIWYPDVSNHQGNLKLEAKTVAVCAKASEGDFYSDPYFAHFRSEAKRVGAFFFAYHWPHSDSNADVAKALANIPRGIGTMLDVEQVGFSYAQCRSWISKYRSKGGTCNLAYIPQWYWQTHWNSCDMSALGAMGVHLVSSNYTTYSDTGPGWTAYGKLTPAIWQYTDKLAYAGTHVDFNAYKGTVEQLKSLVLKGPVMSDSHNSTNNHQVWHEDGTIPNPAPNRYADGARPGIMGETALTYTLRELDTLRTDVDKLLSHFGIK